MHANESKPEAIGQRAGGGCMEEKEPVRLGSQIFPTQYDQISESMAQFHHRATPGC